MNFTRTHSGHEVVFAAPDPSSIDIRDIACSLSRLNRFSGASRLPINVADHSLNVVRLLAMLKAPPATQLLGLVHDAHEAYMGDVIPPVKSEIAACAGFDVVGQLAACLDQAIYRAFRLTSFADQPALSAVQSADLAVFAAEWRDLMPGACPLQVKAASFAIKPRNADRSEEEFLKAFDRLRIEIGPFLDVAAPADGPAAIPSTLQLRSTT